MAIPDAILLKTGPLDNDEWVFVRRHTLTGEWILSAAPALANVAKLVRSSHERWDGGGYPDGLAGEEIPLESRIVAVCDAYAAMRSDRPYRAAMPHADALSELRAHAGTQFDPHVVAAALDVLREPLRIVPSIAAA
jgi:HD-GYP domain-containing protein (c-di-GMP phosphodiesterase class II)